MYEVRELNCQTSYIHIQNYTNITMFLYDNYIYTFLIKFQVLPGGTD